MVTALLFLSKILGFVRETVIAAYFGTSMVADAYQIATMIPIVIFDAVAVALAVTFIPVFTDVFTEYGEEEAKKFVRELAATVTWVVFVLTLLGLIFSPYIVKLIAPGFTAEKYRITVELTRILLPLIIFRVLAGLTSGYLNAKKRFLIPALMGLALNFCVIGAMVFFANDWGIKSLAVGTLLGTAGMLLIQMPSALKNGLCMGLRPNLSNNYIRRIFYLSIPVFFSSAVNQVSFTVDRIMASSLPTGAISSLTYANRLNGFVLGIFVASLNTVFFPSLAELASQKKTDELKHTLRSIIKLTSLIVFPMMVGLMILRVPIIKLLFERGSFDQYSTQQTAIALLMFALGLSSFALRDVLNRVFYVLKDSKTPTYNAAIAVGFNIFLNFLLIKKMGHGGLALATTLSGTFTVILLFYSLRKKIGLIGGRDLLKALSKLALAACGMGFITWYLQTYLPQPEPGNFTEGIRLFVIIGISASVYFGLGYCLGVQEIRIFQQWIINKIKSWQLKIFKENVTG